jgi:hypothetical protein
MNDLLMRAFDGAAADAVAEAQVRVVTHALSVCRLVASERLERGLVLGWIQRREPRLQSLDHVVDAARAKIGRDA